MNPCRQVVGRPSAGDTSKQVFGFVWACSAMALLAGCVSGPTVGHSHGPDPMIRGTRVLLAFSDYKLGASLVDESKANPFEQGPTEKEVQKQVRSFEKALAASGAKVLKAYGGHDRYRLLDLEGRPVRPTLKKIPHHAGAMVFRNGHLVQTIPSTIDGAMPDPYAVLTWGSNDLAIKKMEKDFRTYKKMKGVRADMLTNLSPTDGEVGGNPSFLRLMPTPGRSKRLLEIFLLAEAQFRYGSYAEKY